MDDRAARLERVHAARAQWLHELRNAVNGVGVTVALGRRLLDRGDSDAAAAMLERTETAWAECKELLAVAPDVIGIGPLGNDDLQWRSCDSTAPTAPGSTGLVHTSKAR